MDQEIEEWKRYQKKYLFYTNVGTDSRVDRYKTYSILRLAVLEEKRE